MKIEYQTYYLKYGKGDDELGFSLWMVREKDLTEKQFYFVYSDGQIDTRRDENWSSFNETSHEEIYVLTEQEVKKLTFIGYL